MNDQPKLGNRTLVHTKPALNFSDFFTGVLPPTPAVDYLTYRKSWPWWGNNVNGTCVVASWAGVKALVTWFLTGSEVILSDAEIIALYKTQNPNFPAEDNGMDIQKLLELLQRMGLIAAFGTIDKAKHDPAISIFGFVWISIAVRDSFDDDYSAGRPIRYVPSSTLRGYHSVFGAGHRDTAADDVRFETWTKECAFTQAFWNSSDVGTIWGVILPEHLKSKEFMAGMDMVGLASAFKTLTGRDLPVPTPPATFTVTPPLREVLYTSMPPRIADSRAKYNVGTAPKPLASGESRFIQCVGLPCFPAEALGGIFNLAATSELAAGWLSGTPVAPTSPYSTLNFQPKQDIANGCHIAFVNGGVVVHNGSNQASDFVLDAPGYLVP